MNIIREDKKSAWTTLVRDISVTDFQPLDKGHSPALLRLKGPIGVRWADVAVTQPLRDRSALCIGALVFFSADLLDEDGYLNASRIQAGLASGIPLNTRFYNCLRQSLDDYYDSNDTKEASSRSLQLKVGNIMQIFRENLTISQFRTLTSGFTREDFELPPNTNDRLNYIPNDKKRSRQPSTENTPSPRPKRTCTHKNLK